MRGKFILNYRIELYVKETIAEKYPATALVPVKGVPSTGQAGGTVETTTSSDPVKLYIPERPDTGDMNYACNYSTENLEAVKAVCDNTKKKKRYFNKISKLYRINEFKRMSNLEK